MIVDRYLKIGNWKLENSRPCLARDGYIALISFLVVSAVALAIGIGLGILGVSEAQMGLAEKRGYSSLALTEGCAADALLSAYRDGDYSGGSLSSPEGSCTIAVVKTGDDWTMTIAGTVAGHTKKVVVKINRGNEIVVTGWKELE
jgi:hypothetical protein